MTSACQPGLQLWIGIYDRLYASKRVPFPSTETNLFKNQSPVHGRDILCYRDDMADSQNAPWSSLFAAANAFRELGPWEWMNDNQVFGVKDPATGEVAWCAVLGMWGEVFGLAAYLGPSNSQCRP